MAWLMITARFQVPGIILLTILVSFSHQSVNFINPTYSGSCVEEIGYKCCPPGESCVARNGNCSCKMTCHSLNNCCEDVFCHPKPRTCQDVGCCNNASESMSYMVPAGCDSRFKLYHNDENGNLISSNQPCNSISYCPQNCAEAKFDAGLCKWQFKPVRETCRVYRGNCYCDPYCICFNDCCSDVQENEINDAYYFSLSARKKCALMKARLIEQALIQKYNEDTNEAQIIQDFDYNDSEVYIQYLYAVYVRLQKM